MEEIVYVIEYGRVSDYGFCLPRDYDKTFQSLDDAIYFYHNMKLGKKEYIRLYKCLEKNKVTYDKNLLMGRMMN